MQLAHTENKFEQKTFPIVICCDQIRTPENIGMIFRVCEAFHVQKIIFNSLSPKPSDRAVKRISRSTSSLVENEYIVDEVTKLNELKAAGYKIYALEITSKSKPIQQLTFSTHDKIVLVIGAERNGISKELLSCCEAEFHIPMYGTNSSMNVVNSLSVALYEITNKFNSL
jgi:tRNA G18 (ribose-2'-O)-methylase SpoU